jgi:replication-associated recombination protein RarA
MTRAFWATKTVRGFELGEVTSALQKSIRRGDEEGALTWAVEIDQSGFGAMLWSRLTTITSEDVGLAWTEGPAVIESLYAAWKRMKATKSRHHPERLQVIHAVLLLCRAPKSRLVNDAVWATYGHQEPLVDEIPDYALDAHTARGRAMGRGEEFREGYKLVGETVASPYYDRCWSSSYEWFAAHGQAPDEGLFRLHD